MNNVHKFAWPAVLVIALVLFRGQIANQFGRITEVKVSGGQFELVLQETAKAKNTADTYDVIKGLSKDGIMSLLKTGDQIQILTYDDGSSMRLVDEFTGFVELEKQGLIDANVSLEDVNAANLQEKLSSTESNEIEVRLNQKGQLAWDIIAESVNKAINPQ